MGTPRMFPVQRESSEPEPFLQGKETRLFSAGKNLLIQEKAGFLSQDDRRITGKKLGFFGKEGPFYRQLDQPGVPCATHKASKKKGLHR